MSEAEGNELELVPCGPVKRAKYSDKEESFLQSIPSCGAYEKSYMHRDVVTHVHVTKSQFLITVSQDGVIKFWKKTSNGITFVKLFKSHAGPVGDISVTASGSELASISQSGKSVRIFDITNFDMINMFALDFEPGCVEWVTSCSIDSHEDLAISDSKSGDIHLFSSRQAESTPKRTLDNYHKAPVCRMRLNPVYDIMISADTHGLVQYWRTNQGNFNLAEPPHVLFKRREDTNLDQFRQDKESTEKLLMHNLSYSSNGDFFATTSSDRKIRVFKFKTARLVRMYDESLDKIEELHKEQPLMNNMDFARRIALEKELDRNNITRRENVIFDASGRYILYPTMLGVKVVQLKTGDHVRSLGRDETNFRPLNLSLFQGIVFDKVVRKFNADSLDAGVEDPTLFCTSHKKNRFYCFSHRNFEEDTEEDGGIIKDRDIFNEMPTREEMMAAIEIEEAQKERFESATIHTTMGDIHLKLFPNLAPKACENFGTHSKNGYYNNHIFHRVIKQFMIQTGDPTGTGSGGESIWDEEFEDEFCDELKHDKPFVLSMANCGPNTNGSQFFITVAPCPFLDNKHTIFGEVTKGMDICQQISKVKTDPKTDKPVTDIKIINISVH